MLTKEEINHRLTQDFCVAAANFTDMMHKVSAMNLCQYAAFVKNIPDLELNGWGRDNNCLNFALNLNTENCLYPGEIGAYELKSFSARETLNGVAHDKLIPIKDIFECADNYFPVALFHSKGRTDTGNVEDLMGDMHWYGLRQENGDLVWAHKLGERAPKKAWNNNIFQDVLYKHTAYSEYFLGYFAVPPEIHSP